MSDSQPPPHNSFDKAARYAMHADPEAFLEWSLNLPREEGFFETWLDTRGLSLPWQPDRIRDNVVRLCNHDHGGEPWGVVIELQSEPHPDMPAGPVCIRAKCGSNCDRTASREVATKFL